MKLRHLLAILMLLVSLGGFGQGNLSSGALPVALPPPIPQAQKTSKTDKTDTVLRRSGNCERPAKLISFTMPCCIDTQVMVARIAKIGFDKGDCPATEVVFSPAILTINAPYKQQVVTASCDGVVLTATVNIVGPYIGTYTSADVSFEEEADKVRSIMMKFKNGNSSYCSTNGSTAPTGNLRYKRTYLCCENEIACLSEKRRYAGTYNWSFSDTCQLTLYGFHDVASLDVALQTRTALDLTVNDETSCIQDKRCVPVKGSVRISGNSIPRGIISGKLQLFAESDYNGEFCFQPIGNKPSGKFSGKEMRVKGTVSSAWGLVSHNVDFVVYDQW